MEVPHLVGLAERPQEDRAISLAVDPDFKAAYYDLGAFHLGLGDSLRAWAAYREGIDRYGVDEGAVWKLQAMIQNDIQANLAQNALTRFFKGVVDDP